jgi:glycosyltransferase involved in cell wall biosynthesis
MATVAANIIVGQKYEQYFQFTLQSIKWVDEIVIVNTGDSNNPNLKTIRDFAPNAKVIQFEGAFTFSAARNKALENTKSLWILWVDADEVHFNDFERVVREIIAAPKGDAYQFGFHHFILDMFHYQNIDLRLNLFMNVDKRWHGNVHEYVHPIQKAVPHEYRYHHYGYTKPQREIYENWRLYWSLNPDELSKLNEERDPDGIISDRVTVAHPYIGPYPEVIQSYIQQQPMKVDGYKFL